MSHNMGTGSESSKKRKRKHGASNDCKPAIAPTASVKSAPSSTKKLSSKGRKPKRRKTSSSIESEDKAEVETQDLETPVQESDQSSDEDEGEAAPSQVEARDKEEDQADDGDDDDSSEASDEGEGAGPELEETVDTKAGTKQVTETDLPTDSMPSLPGTTSTPQNFAELDLSEKTMRAIQEMKFEKMT